MNPLRHLCLFAIAVVIANFAYAHSSYEICPQCDGSGETWDACEECGGSGAYPVLMFIACNDCSGTGEVSGEACDNCGGLGETTEEIWVTCAQCDGSGISSSVCPTCNGSGIIETESFSVLAFHCAEIHQKPISIAT